MAVGLHDLSLPELRSLCRQLGGPADSYKRTEIFGFLLEYYDYDDDHPLRSLYERAADSSQD